MGRGSVGMMRKHRQSQPESAFVASTRARLGLADSESHVTCSTRYGSAPLALSAKPM